ncbi:MAG: S16 family serine protease [Candidatus Micrarchaeota archaeon]
MRKKNFHALVILAAFVLAVALGYFAVPVPKSIAFSAPAITEDGKGRLVGFRMSLQPGPGRLLINVESVAYREDTDSALRKARSAAENYLGVRLANYDIVLDVESDGFREVSGESAGALFAAALIALESGRKLNPDAAISAVLDEEGILQPVGGIEEKIIAAERADRSVFVVSGGQSVRFEDELARNITIRRAYSIRDALPYVLS